MLSKGMLKPRPHGDVDLWRSLPPQGRNSSPLQDHFGSSMASRSRQPRGKEGGKKKQEGEEGGDRKGEGKEGKERTGPEWRKGGRGGGRVGVAC